MNSVIVHLTLAISVILCLVSAKKSPDMNISLDTLIGLGSKSDSYGSIISAIHSFLSQLKSAINTIITEDDIKRPKAKTKPPKSNSLYKKTEYFKTKTMNKKTDIVSKRHIVNGHEILRDKFTGSGVISGFMYKVGIMLTQAKEEELKMFIKIFDKEMVKCYDTAIFQEIVSDPRIKYYLKNSIKDLEQDPQMLIHNLKQTLANIHLRKSPYNKLIDYLDRLYNKDDEKFLENSVNELSSKPLNQQTLANFFSKSIKTLIFNKYITLNYKTQIEIADIIKEIGDYLSMTYRSKSEVKHDDDVEKQTIGENKLAVSMEKQNSSSNSDTVEVYSHQAGQVPDSSELAKVIVFDKNINISVEGHLPKQEDDKTSSEEKLENILKIKPNN